MDMTTVSESQLWDELARRIVKDQVGAMPEHLATDHAAWTRMVYRIREEYQLVDNDERHDGGIYGRLLERLRDALRRTGPPPKRPQGYEEEGARQDATV